MGGNLPSPHGDFLPLPNATMNRAINNSYALGSLVAGLLLCLACSFDEDPSKASAQTRKPCRVEIQLLAQDSVRYPSADTLCTMVLRSLGALVAAGSHAGVEPGDSAAVSKAFIAPIGLGDAQGGAPRLYWFVTLSLYGRPYDAEVWIDRKTGSLENVRRIHKPF